MTTDASPHTPAIMRPCLTPYPDRVASEAVVALTRRWLQRAVIGLNLCPFAKSVFVRKQIRYAVTAATSREELRDELQHELVLLCEADPVELDTTLIIHPKVLQDFIDYNYFLADADAMVATLRLEGTLQVASFHPRYEFAASAGDDMANYSNRSPYPMLHLLREASIDRAVAAFPDASVIFERNIETLRALGHTGWAELWTDHTGPDDHAGQEDHEASGDDGAHEDDPARN